MNNGGFSGKPQNSSSSSGDDIPAALRDTPDVSQKSRFRLPLLIVGGVVGFVFLAIASGFLFFITAQKKDTNQQPISTNTNAASSSSPIPGDNQAKTNDALLGHFPYPEAPETELASISLNGRLRMRKTAAQQFQAMQQAARSAGVNLVPISAFRSIQEQKQLFFTVGAQRNQTPAERASLSAPPGYSEHHTGYAVDIGDGNVPATNLSENFEKTKAYEWLSQNAAKFSFELSFPRNNPQGVSYEPWHWRFVGDTQSLETFYKAKNVKPVPTP
ncbi:M15 family metallopeptidase [Calothrix sp. UHCC 0171]|uniref:M15 family metallopeptidase n=1 Tax=Calothrix sp. UHCC 0171 TaxID=3110245 RepID=UPI002B21B3E9|nr:D-alanyl-D-alanine carboxypeptidase family protein [Calothrix sp. UHCC 0171]MEA5570991.1 D-alanyl-D-alanine carboxypeptidase family protein [Calothrix sp. UHCC 0171]